MANVNGVKIDLGMIFVRSHLGMLPQLLKHIFQGNLHHQEWENYQDELHQQEWTNDQDELHPQEWTNDTLQYQLLLRQNKESPKP